MQLLNIMRIGKHPLRRSINTSLARGHGDEYVSTTTQWLYSSRWALRPSVTVPKNIAVTANVRVDADCAGQSDLWSLAGYLSHRLH